MSSSPEINRARDIYRNAYRGGWRRDPSQSVSEWADKFRVLSEVARPIHF